MIRRILDLSEKIVYILIIEILRLFTKHDTYLVASQINLKSVDPVDSWTFFCWLQKHNISSRYIIDENADFYQKFIKLQDCKDIIVLPERPGTAKILHPIKAWIHARAFVVEWNLLNNTIDYWLKHLHDMRYVMLQHGITGGHISNIHLKGFLPFNDINVSSYKEKEIIESIPGIKQNTCFIGGLPRYDNLKNEADANAEEKILFVMFTWRNYPKGMPIEEIEKSVYWQGIKSFMSDENIERLKRDKIKVVMALHHSILRSIPELHTHSNILIAEQKDIKYWISHAHGFLTDFSSVAFDFMFTNKPVVFWIPDLLDKTLDPNDIGYGDKVLSAIERRKDFYNTVDTLDEAMLLLEQYAKNGFVLEKEKIKLSGQWFVNSSDISRKIYEGIESRLK